MQFCVTSPAMNTGFTGLRQANNRIDLALERVEFFFLASSIIDIPDCIGDRMEMRNALRPQRPGKVEPVATLG